MQPEYFCVAIRFFDYIVPVGGGSHQGQVAKYNSALRLNSTKHFLPGLAVSTSLWK